MDPRHGSEASHQQLNSDTAGEPADVLGGGQTDRVCVCWGRRGESITSLNNFSRWPPGGSV